MAVAVKMEFDGIDELIEKIEEIGGEKLLDNVNRKIIKEGQNHGKDIISKGIPKSNDVSLSGPKRGGSRMVPGGHGADNVPVSSVTKKGKSMGGFVGWRPSDEDENFYIKFFEEGVSPHRAKGNYNRPVPGVRKIGMFNKSQSEVRDFVNGLGVDEYNKLLERAFS